MGDARGAKRPRTSSAPDRHCKEATKRVRTAPGVLESGTDSDDRRPQSLAITVRGRDSSDLGSNVLCLD